jgi:hypothetical protein
MKIQYDFLALRDLVACMKQKYYFLQKPGILIPDLYLLRYLLRAFSSLVLGFGFIQLSP